MHPKISYVYIAILHIEKWSHMALLRVKELNDDWVSRFCGFHELSDNDSDEGQSWS